MSTQPSEAFPWREDKNLPDRIVDANEDMVGAFCGYGGDRSIFSVGAAERVRMALALPALIELARRYAGTGDMRAQKILSDMGVDYSMPTTGIGRATWSTGDEPILARIEGKS